MTEDLDDIAFIGALRGWAASQAESSWLDRLLDLAEAGLPTPPPTRNCDGCGREMTARPESGRWPQYDGALPITFHGGYFGFIEDECYGGTACTLTICPSCAQELCDTVPWIGERLQPDD